MESRFGKCENGVMNKASKPGPAYTSTRSVGFCAIWVCISSSSSSAQHTNGPRIVPRCGALSLLQKPPHYKGGVIVVLWPLFAAALVVHRRYLIMVSRIQMSILRFWF